MKTMAAVLACIVLLTGAALAASIDGKWVAERKIERDGNSFTIIQTFDLKADGDRLGGEMTMSFGDMEPRTSKIVDGKLDGNKFSFATVVETPNGEMKFSYEGTLEGDTLKGTSSREGGQSRPFEAKRK